MAKRKKKKAEEYDFYKNRTKSTIKAINKNLEAISVEEIMDCSFYMYRNEFEKNLMKDLDAFIIKEKLEPGYLNANLHKYYKKKAAEIKKNKQYREYYDLVLNFNRVHRSSASKMRSWIQHSYYDLIIQLATYFIDILHSIIGIQKNGKLLLQNALYPVIDKDIYEIEKIVRNLKDDERYNMVIAQYKKRGYPVNDAFDMKELAVMEATSSNMFHCMCPLIDESNSEIVKGPYISPHNKILDKCELEMPTSAYKESLKKRKRLLPKKGIEVEGLSNIKSVQIMEKLYKESMYMLYRVTLDSGNFSGFYDIENDYFYSVFGTMLPDMIALDLQNWLENYVLGVYSVLTTDIDHREELYVYDGKETGDNKKVNRSKLVDTYTEVEAYIRKLPVGASASEEAISLAKKYGIELDPGETFVKPYVKNIKVIESKK